MGHIHLAAPVSHIWYFKGIPSRMDLILDIGPKNLEKVLYFASYIVIDPGETDIPFKKILSETEYRELCEQYGSKAFRVGMGAEAILELLKMVNLEEEEVRLKEELANTTSQKAARLIKRIEVVEAFKNAGTKPEWMILTEIPVIPPDLRPMSSLMVDVLQLQILMIFTEELLTEITDLQDFLSLELLKLLYVTRRECFRKLLMLLSIMDVEMVVQ